MRLIAGAIPEKNLKMHRDMERGIKLCQVKGISPSAFPISDCEARQIHSVTNNVNMPRIDSWETSSAERRAGMKNRAQPI